MQNALVGRQPPYSNLPIKDISNNQLQEIDLSKVVQLFEGYPAPAIKDISLAIKDVSLDIKDISLDIKDFSSSPI